MSVPSASLFIITSALYATSVPLYLKTWPKWLCVLSLALASTTLTLFYLEPLGKTSQNSKKHRTSSPVLLATCSPQSCSPRTLFQQLHWLPIKHRIDFKIANITFRTLHSLTNRLTYVHPCMPVIPLILSDSLTLISCLLRLSAHHLALASLASQPLKSGTLSLYLSVPVPVLTPSVVISRPTTASRPSTPSPLAPQIRLC